MIRWLYKGRADQIVVGHAGDGQHRRLLHLGVQQAVNQVHCAGRRGREAHAELAGELRVADGGHGRHFFVPHVDVAHLVRVLAQGFHETVDPVTRQPENSVGAPFDKPLDQDVGRGSLL